MRKIFIDTNVLFDFFAERQPFDKEAEEMMELAYEKQIELYCAATSYTTLFYLLAKLKGKVKSVQAIRDLRELINTIRVDNAIIDKALENTVPDFEEAIQIACAHTIKDIQAIVTRNPKLFKTKRLLVQTPKEFLDTINQTINE
ncbi:MAG: type II toxin-antitoxin system VapC family toxin [Sediminibacterium sp.]